MVVSPAPPLIVVRDAPDLLRAERFARIASAEAMLDRRGARQERADSLPFLTGSAEGRAFLALALPRALARGEPAAHCPATGMVGGTAGAGQDRGTVARAALERCLARLADRTDCGCKLLALDRAVTVPREALAYATGTAARLRAPELGIDGMLVAEEEPGGVIVLRDLRGPVGRLERHDDGSATLALLGGAVSLTGWREAVGYRRGRLAEHVYLTDTEGRRAVLLIGFSPADLIGGEAAALAWRQRR